MGVTTGKHLAASLSVTPAWVCSPIHPGWPLHSPSPACHDQQLIRSTTLGSPLCAFFFFQLFPFGIFQIGIFRSLEFPRVEASHLVVTRNDSSPAMLGFLVFLTSCKLAGLRVYNVIILKALLRASDPSSNPGRQARRLLPLSMDMGMKLGQS